MATSTEGEGEKSFDFVIIGGGTAGLVLAARLSEDSNVTVAIIEAGKSRLEDPNILMPAMMPALYSGSSDYDWCFKSEPQDGLGGRTIALPRGKVLGGTSAMNMHMVAYASKVDIDNWGKLGNRYWSFDKLAPYYKKFERFSPPSVTTAKALDTSDLDPSIHGFQGPVHTTIPESYWPLAEAWVPTFRNLGLGLKTDSKSGISVGGYSSLSFMDANTATRSYAATAYYAPNSARPNLSLISDALVEKIFLTSMHSEVVASGVKVQVEGRSFRVEAKKEVLLCAGAFGSPQILELSGIGSASLLASHNIEVIVDNDNVGENLQDHALAYHSVEVADGELTVDALRNPEFAGQAYKEYAENKTGLLAAPLISSSALLPYKVTSTESEQSQAAEEIDLLLAGEETLRPGLAKQYQLTKEGLLSDTETSIQLLFVHAGVPVQDSQSSRRMGDPENRKPGSYITIGSCLLHPFSRGHVHIQSSDPTSHPIIDPCYLSHPLDIKIFAKHMLHVSKITTTEPLASRLKDKGTALQPGYYTLTEENVEEFLRTQLGTEHHPIATCSMMPRDEGGVVNERFKVYGTKNLRVVDASVIPLQTACNTTTTVYAIAERAADMIKEDWGLAL